jgi:hypothetical protein
MRQAAPARGPRNLLPMHGRRADPARCLLAMGAAAPAIDEGADRRSDPGRAFPKREELLRSPGDIALALRGRP